MHGAVPAVPDLDARRQQQEAALQRALLPLLCLLLLRRRGRAAFFFVSAFLDGPEPQGEVGVRLPGRGVLAPPDYVLVLDFKRRKRESRRGRRRRGAGLAVGEPRPALLQRQLDLAAPPIALAPLERGGGGGFPAAVRTDDGELLAEVAAEVEGEADPGGADLGVARELKGLRDEDEADAANADAKCAIAWPRRRVAGAARRVLFA